MLCYFEIRATHGIDVYPGDYLKIALLEEEIQFEKSMGCDDYNLQGLLLPGKRVSALGRCQSYTLSDLPAGLSAIEAAPPEPVPFCDRLFQNLQFAFGTNLFHNEDQLKHYLCLRIIQENETALEIPLDSPFVKINCISDGNFRVSVQL